MPSYLKTLFRKISLKPDLAFFYLLIFLLPVQLGKHFWPSFVFVNGIRVDYLAPTIYLTDILILGILISWIGKKLKIKISKFTVCCLLFAIANILLAHNKFLAFFKALKIIELSLLAFYIIKEKPSFKVAIYCLLFAVCYSSIIAWAQFIKQSSLNGIFYFLGERTFNLSTPGISRADLFGKLILRPYATFPHPNVLAGFLTVVLPFIIFLPQIIKRKIQKLIFYFPLFFLTLATIFITFSRTAWTNSILMISFVLFYKLKSKRFLTFFFVLFIFYFIFFIFPLSSNRILSLFSTDQESFIIRQKLMLVSFKMIKNNLLFGVGLNNFIPEINMYATLNSFQELQPVHNIYLLITAETGIGGLLLFLVLIILTGRILLNGQMVKWLNKTKQFNNLTIEPFFLSFSSILFLSLFDHYFFTLQQTQILLAVIAGFIFNLKKDKISM